MSSSKETVSVSPSIEQLAARRTQRLIRGAFSSTVSKIAVLLVNALSIPITIRYLGVESFGVWITISTILSMLLVLDLGVANSLTNFISEAYAKEDQEHASTYATTAFGVMTALAALIGFCGWLLWPHLSWAKLFHLSSHGPDSILVGHAVAAAFTVFLIGLPASLAPKILGGYQELRSASLFQAFGSVCSLIFLLVLVRLHAGLVALVAASSAALVLANLGCLFWIWLFHKPWLTPRFSHLNKSAARRMMQSGSELFVLQLAALVVFNSDNLVVTHYLGPAQVASYSVAWRLVGYAAVAQTLITPALWPAFSEAFARGDMHWVRRTFARTLWITMSLSLLFCLLFIAEGQRIIRLWAGQAAVPTQTLIVLLCVWTIISTFMNNTSIVLTSKGETRLQAYSSIAGAALNLALSVYWVQRLGVIGVILGTIVSYVTVMIAPQIWKVYQILQAPHKSEVATSAEFRLHHGELD